MKILILSHAFEGPYFNARLRSQCDYLTKQGHHVEVYTEPWDELQFEHDYTIDELGDKNTSYFKWLLGSIYAFFTNYKERKFAYMVLWESRKTKFDLVYCSTPSCFPLGAASLVAKVKGLPLHVDLWDMPELTPSYVRYSWWHPIKALRQKVFFMRRNHVLAGARCITTVSPVHMEKLKAINPHVELLYNWFDPEQFAYQPTPTSLFRINFFGISFTSQNIDMILHVMEKFRTELPKAQWMFYSNDLTYSHIKHSRPNICGILPSEVLPGTLQQTSLVLLFNDKEDNGLNTEQFYQALGAERPVLFTDTASGAVPDLIALTNLGIATDNVKKAMDYIRALYHQWEEQGYTHPDVQNKQLFNRQIQGKHFEDILACSK